MAVSVTSILIENSGLWAEKIQRSSLHLKEMTVKNNRGGKRKKYYVDGEQRHQSWKELAKVKRRLF